MNKDTNNKESKEEAHKNSSNEHPTSQDSSEGTLKQEDMDIAIRAAKINRPPSNFVGLLNQFVTSFFESFESIFLIFLFGYSISSYRGATCYLNSLIQLLFMTPEMRAPFLSLTPEEIGLVCFLFFVVITF